MFLRAYIPKGRLSVLLVGYPLSTGDLDSEAFCMCPCDIRTSRGTDRAAISRIITQQEVAIALLILYRGRTMVSSL